MNRLEQLDKYSARLEDEINKLENKIIELSAEIGMYQNENENSTKDIEKYWKIEEELGCPLEVMFKAIQNGIIVRDYYDIGSGSEYTARPVEIVNYPQLQYTYMSEDDLEEHDYFKDYANNWCFYFDTYQDDCQYNELVKLKDYQKTWWLKGEK